MTTMSLEDVSEVLEALVKTIAQMARTSEVQQQAIDAWARAQETQQQTIGDLVRRIKDASVWYVSEPPLPNCRGRFCCDSAYDGAPHLEGCSLRKSPDISPEASEQKPSGPSGI